MADMTLGRILKNNIRTVPKSLALYACAGVFGALALTALELATKIDPPVAPAPITEPVGSKSVALPDMANDVVH